MTVIVVDAGVVATALADDDGPGREARSALRGHELAAPELVDLEVCSVLRRLVIAGTLGSSRAGQAVADLGDLPLMRAPHAPLVARCWELRHNLTPYDAAYVALAEALGASLLTIDRRLAAAPGPRCAIDVLR